MAHTSLSSLSKSLRLPGKASERSLNNSLHGLGDWTLSIQGPCQPLSWRPIEHTFPEYVEASVQAHLQWFDWNTQLVLAHDGNPLVLPHIYQSCPAIRQIAWSMESDLWVVSSHGARPLDPQEHEASAVSSLEFVSAFGPGEADIDPQQGYDYGGEYTHDQQLDSVCQTQRYFHTGLSGSDILSRSVTVGQRIQSGGLSLRLSHVQPTLECIKDKDAWIVRTHHPWSMTYVSQDYTSLTNQRFLIRFKRHRAQQDHGPSLLTDPHDTGELS